MFFNKQFWANEMFMCKIKNQTNLDFLGHLHYFFLYKFLYMRFLMTHDRPGNTWLYISRSILHWSVNFFLSYLGFKSLSFVCLFVFSFHFILECNWVLCQVYSKVIQLYIHTYNWIIQLYFFNFFSHLYYDRIMSRVPCVVKQVLVSYLF